MIDFSAPICALDGALLRRPLDGNYANQAQDNLIVLTLGFQCRTALALDMRDDPPEQKIERIALALRIPEQGEAALTAGETQLILTRLKAGFGALVNYRVAELLDPESVKLAWPS
jgi:hypothetical protein